MRFFGDDAVEERVGVGEDLAGLGSLLGIVEDARVDAFQAPGVEEGRPVDVLAEGGEREVVEDADAGELGRGNVFDAPVDRVCGGAGFGERRRAWRWGAAWALRRLRSRRDAGDEGGFAVVAEQAGGDGDGAAGVEDVDDRLAVVGGDLDGGVGAAGGGSADEQRELEALALHLAGDVDHLVERGRDEAAEADDVGLLGSRARSRIFSQGP
jgi:hypothetical protein